MSIQLFARGDRLGANIFNFLTQVIYAVHNKLYIKYDRNNLSSGDHEPYNINYNKSIFIETIFDYIDNYNKTFITIPSENINIKTNDFFLMMSRSVLNVKCDLITYFRENIFNSIKDNFYNKSLSKNYQVPFDPKKTILVHLRMDDCKYRNVYDGRVCSNYFRKIMNRDETPNNTLHHNLIQIYYCNHQTPEPFHKIQEQINIILSKHPDYEVIIITNPGEELKNIPYRKIQNEDESLDLFLLCNSEIVIFSKSTFALSSLFFGMVKKAYIPLWGHLPCFGLYTKYDKQQYNYFV
jgi:hypothetical protein